MIVDLAFVKTHAGLSSDTTYDALLTEIIGAVGSLFDAEVGFSWEVVSTDAYYDGPPSSPRLLLAYGPIVAVSTCIESSTTITAAAGNFRIGRRTLTRLSAGAPIAWLPGTDNIRVVYTHGYVVDASLGGFNLPRAVRLAAAEESRHRFALAQPGGNRLDLVGKVTGREGGAAQYLGDALLPTTVETLRAYREII